MDHDPPFASAAIGLPGSPGSAAPRAVGWTPAGAGSWSFVAEDRLVDPVVTIPLAAPADGPCRIRFGLRTARIETIEVAFRTAAGRRHALWLNLFQPHLIDHPFPFCAVAADPDVGAYDLDLDLGPGETGFGADPVVAMDLRLAEEGNWRVHPWVLPEALLLAPEAPAGAALAVRRLRIDRIDGPRRGPAHGTLTTPLPPRYAKSGQGRRDAVVFAAGVPRDALHVGEHLLATLARHHADSRIFAGLNRDCCPEFEEAARGSGLDIVVRRSPPTMRSTRDAAAFIAALDAFRESAEPFDLVWLGHTKGGGHPHRRDYARARWVMEKRYWGRRDVIDGYFADRAVGLYAPNYLAQWRGWTADAEAAMRLAGIALPPPAIAAWTTFYAMRADHLRLFCARAPRAFFETGVEPFGGTFYFFEWGLPNVPIALGFDAVVERGQGRTTLPETRNLGATIEGDERQAQTLVRRQLEAYRRDPAGFVPPLTEVPLGERDTVRLLAAGGPTHGTGEQPR